MAKGRPDYSPTAVDVVLRPEWAAKQGTDKSFYTYKTDAAAMTGVASTYTVPAGKTLYLVSVSVLSNAYDSADAEKNQMVEADLVELVGATCLWQQGGNGGMHAAFPTPIVLSAGQQLSMTVSNFSNHVSSISITVLGYEI